MNLAVNARFYAARTTGVQRVARELVARLVGRTDATLFLPRGIAPPDPVGRHARVVRGGTRGPVFEQLELPARVALEGCDAALHPANAGPVRGRGRVLLLHDGGAPLRHPEWFTPLFRAWYGTMVVRAARGAAHIVTFSRWSRAEIVNVIGIEPERVSVIGQGVAPFTEPASPEAVSQVRQRFGLPERYILAAGGGEARKNIDFLLGVLARWREAGGDVPDLAVVGAPYSHVQRTVPVRDAPAGGGRGEGRGVGRDGRGGHAVRWLGHVPDDTLHALYTGAAAFCFPSLYEAFGRPPLEAMACGTPALVAEYGCAREVLGDSATILPLEPDAWVHALRELLEDPDVRARRAERGRVHAQRFDWAGPVDKLLAICRAVAAGNGGS